MKHAFPFRCLVRRRVHRGYLIFYRLKEQQVEVLHVLNGVQDYEPILFHPPEPGADPE